MSSVGPCPSLPFVPSVFPLPPPHLTKTAQVGQFRVILHGLHRTYRVQGPKSQWGLSLSPSTPEALLHFLHTPSIPSWTYWLPALCLEALSLCFETHLRGHLLQEAFPDPLSWL